MTRHVILYSDGEGLWTAECLTLPDCVGRGRTKHEAVRLVREEIARQLDELRACGGELPFEESFEILAINL